VAQVQPASEQDRRGAGPVLAEASQQYPALRVVWADGGYSGCKLPLKAGHSKTGVWQLVTSSHLLGRLKVEHQAF
jgi:hypothetical protein